ncbi:MAG: hypothetical protein ACXIVO_13690 [Glycocaulis sp.]
MSRAQLVIRLATQDADKVKAALRATGTEGQRMAAMLDRAGRQGDRGLRAVDRASRDLQGSVNRLAGRVPVLGNALTAIGPAGIAAAAGIGAIALAMRSAMRIAREALTAFDNIGKAADRLALSTDTFQALSQAAVEEGVSMEQVNSALTAYIRLSTQAAQGRGELVTALRNGHPVLLREIQLAANNEERLEAVARALREARTEQEFYSIATAAFGRNGLAVAQMLARQEEGIRGLTARAREMGVVVDEHVIRNAERMSNELATAERIMSLSLQQAMIDLAPVLVSSAQLFADIARGVGRLVDRFRDLEDMSTRGLQERKAELEATLMLMGIASREQLEAERGRADNSLLGRMGVNARGAALDTAERAFDEIDEIEASLARRAEAAQGRGPGANDGTVSDPQALAERNRMEAEAIRIRAELGDITGVVAQRQQALDALVRAGLLTQEQADASLQRFTENLDGTAEAMRRAEQVAASVLTPSERYARQVEELNALLEAGRISQDVHTRAMEAARRTYEEAEPALRTAAEIRERMLTIEERLAREAERVAEAVESGGLSAETAAEYMRVYEEELRRTGDASRWLRLEQEILNGVINGTITSFEDLGRVALRVLYEIARQAILTADSTQSLGGFFASAFGSVFGGAGGSGGRVGVPTRHGGGDAVATPHLARRFGLGLMPGEGLHILREGEPVLSHSMTDELMALSRAALARQGGGGVEVNIHNHAGVEIERNESTGTNGRRRLDLVLRDQTRSDMASGEFDEAMLSRLAGARKPVGVR